MDKNFAVTDEVMEKINGYAVSPLTKEQVYCFSVVLCDNDVDRDNECFSKKSLDKLAELYIGRTGIFDHDPKGENQSARIFDTAVREFPGRKTASGEAYAQLIGSAYMVRTDDNKSLIAEIDGGIKKEVSVGCSVSSKICSVCGTDNLKTACAHTKGKTYGSRLCFMSLENPVDAYEWSFVAVPAQRNAGVTKKYSSGHEGFSPEEHARLSGISQAACESLKEDIIRLSYFTKPSKSAKAVKTEADKMDFYGLLKLKKELSEQVRKMRNPINTDFAAVTDISGNSAFKLCGK